MIKPVTRLCTAFGGAALCLVGLGACSPEHQDIRNWMTAQRQKATPRAMVLPKHIPYNPSAYEVGSLPDPFGAERLTVVLLAQTNKGDALLRTEMARTKEPLENMPLESLKMVGSLKKGNQYVALVKVNNLIYQVRVGNYLGTDYGRIEKISENSIDLREIV